MEGSFDEKAAKNFLREREESDKQAQEAIRKTVLATTISSLKHLFSNTNVEVFLVGSVTVPYSFQAHSDVDIVLKNFTGDRFDVWTKMEDALHRNVEVILFEHCHFQEHVLKNGYKVL